MYISISNINKHIPGYEQRPGLRQPLHVTLFQNIRRPHSVVLVAKVVIDQQTRRAFTTYLATIELFVIVICPRCAQTVCLCDWSAFTNFIK